MTYLSAVIVSIIEGEMKKVEFSKRLKVLIIIVLIILIIEFTFFTFKLPWHDIFADPYA